MYTSDVHKQAYDDKLATRNFLCLLAALASACGRLQAGRRVSMPVGMRRPRTQESFGAVSRVNGTCGCFGCFTVGENENRD